MGRETGEEISDIDFVITWVDGSDPKWQQAKAEFAPPSGTDDREERYRDWGLLPYWFRGVEKFAPWVRKVHFVTWGHLPEWLNTKHTKLHIVRHEDYIPQEFLPTFNSHTIELYFHKIKGLSEHFVYFNDDIFPIDTLRPGDFFKKGQPCDMLAFQPVVANPKNPVMSHLFLNNALVLAKYFNKRENVKAQPGNYFKPGYPLLYFCYNFLELMFPLFTGFYTVHGAYPFCRGTFREVWEKEGEILRETCSHRIRSSKDVSPYLIREWQKLAGRFHAQNVTRDFRYFDVADSNPKLLRTITAQSRKTICINDANQPVDFWKVQKELQQAFHQILPEKSDFERS